MKQLALIAVMTIASATAMAQTTPNTATTSGKTAQEANAAKSGTAAADKGQANADAKGAQSGTATMGAGTPMGMGKPGRWAAMDANKDGMVSQEEYMAFHASHWGKMKQTNGMVPMAEMEAAMSGGTAGGPN